MAPEIHHRICEKKAILAKKRPLPRVALERLRAEFAVEWTYNSNAIEGNTISLRETRMVIEHGLTVSGKTLAEHFEINNHQKAIAFVESLAKKRSAIKESEILEIHRLVLENIEMEFAGRYRTGRVRILGANFVPPNHLKISELIGDLLGETLRNPEKLNAVELAARFHHRFVWIHPFYDGNGRTARLLMNLLLMREGFPPAIILVNDRRKYYRALDAANDGNYDPFELFIAQAVERSLDIYLEAAGLHADDEYVLLSELTKKFPYSQEYLSLLARTGKIDAYKRSRNWMATERSIEDYLRRIK
ncbi:MAG: Fic family protein [Pyrinomonadaceae bacterium]